MTPAEQRSSDRCDWAPKHTGPNVFPNFYLFSRLVRWAHRPSLLACRDLTFGFEASYTQLLTDVLYLRNYLRAHLDPGVIARVDREDEVYILLLGPCGYEFTVGFLALVALGAVVVPISPDLPVKEATYFASKSQAVAVLMADRCIKLGSGLEDVMSKDHPTFSAIKIRPHLIQPPLDPADFQVSSDRYMDLNAPGYVIFTSGTTGPPKGGVKRRGFLYDVASQFSDMHGIEPGDLVLHVLPVHHATGITVTLLPFLWSGGTIEFRSGGFDVAWTWERMRRGDLAFFSGVPTIYMRLMQFWEQRLKDLPEATQYAQGASAIRAMLCGTSALPRPLQQKWTALRGGRGILTRYGGTEFGNAFTVTPWLMEQGVPDGSVGQKGPGVDVKLSQGNEGEILMRNPLLFSTYLFDEAGTRGALDDEGYFKTGDIARRGEGGYYFIQGRANIDILKSGGYKLSALDIEREILGLPYVSEVIVVGVADEEFGQRVAAAIVLREDMRTSLTLDELRADLRGSLAGYKMPTLLRVVREIRKNATGKAIKKVLVDELFPTEGHQEVQRWVSSKSKL